MVDIPTSIWVPALVAFLAVALGTVSLVLLWEWFQEQQRKRHMVDQLRSLANDPTGCRAGGLRLPLGGPAVSLAPPDHRAGPPASRRRVHAPAGRADLEPADPDPVVAGPGGRRSGS